MVESCLEKNSEPEEGEKQEDADAFFVLGTRYSTGRDVEHDLVAAHKWFNLAAMMGHEEARQSRAELAREMPADRIAEAQRMARAWLANRAACRQCCADVSSAEAAVRPIYVRRRAQAMRSAMSFSRVVGAEG
jgi:TPR repeat protein